MLENYQSIIFIIILFTGIIFVFRTLLYYSYDENLQRNDEKILDKLKIGPLQSLLNGSGINNIPKLNIKTTNIAISNANICGAGPVRIGNGGTHDDCIKMCLNSTASVINVIPGEQYTYEQTILQPGSHCIIGPRPECDMTTSIAIMTVNFVQCRSKFPNIVGGKLGTTIVACNNNYIQDPKNYLWDYKLLKKFDPWTTTITDENEKLPDSNYRFRCKFEGTDLRGNNYQEHPFNRFHPISNYCAALIYDASFEVKTVIKNDGSFECDCGINDVTRVKNMYDNDKTSQCINESMTIKNHELEKKEITIPYKCFTLYSPLEDVGKYLPCPPGVFTLEKHSQMSQVSILFTNNDKELIEHPQYKIMSRTDVSGVDIRENKTMIVD